MRNVLATARVEMREQTRELLGDYPEAPFRGSEWQAMGNLIGVTEVMEGLSPNDREAIWAAVQVLLRAQQGADPNFVNRADGFARGISLVLAGHTPRPSNYKSWFAVFERLAEKLATPRT